MYRLKSRAASAVPALSLALLALFSACSEDVLCPEGFDKSGKLCLQEDGGEPVTTGGRGDSSIEIEGRQEDGSISGSSGDAGQVDATADVPAAMDAASDATTSDASGPVEASVGQDDAASQADSSMPPAPECDSAHPCASAGYSCMNNKCVSACAQTRCDANATCALMRGAPVCSCNTGYLAQGTGTRLMCVRDVACSELDCDENATCEVGSDQLRHCVCKTDYTGNGKVCTRVSCPSLSTLRNETRNVSTSDSTTTVGKVATFTCNSGYKNTGGGNVVCDETGKWSGTPTMCTKITCAKPTATVPNATLTPDQASYQIDARATYKCDSGYKGGEVQIACSREGTWPTATPTLNCVPYCGDGTVNNGEECDFNDRGNPLSAVTCDAMCKRCPNGVCERTCSATSPCPDLSNDWDSNCSNSKCVLTGCTTGFNPRNCPNGTMCVAGTGGAYGTCVSQSDSED